MIPPPMRHQGILRLSPQAYPFWDNIKMEIRREYGQYGPHASVVSEITKTFLSEAHRDRIL